MLRDIAGKTVYHGSGRSGCCGPGRTGRQSLDKTERLAEYPSEEEIKAVISGYRVWAEELKARISSLREEIEDLERSMRRAAEYEREALRLVREPEIVYNGAAREKRQKKCRNEMLRALSQLEKQAVRIRRIYLAYMTLPLEEYEILHALYEEHIPWRRISQHLSISKQTAVKRRGEAIRHLREKLPGEERKENSHRCEWDFPWRGTNLNMTSGGC